MRQTLLKWQVPQNSAELEKLIDDPKLIAAADTSRTRRLSRRHIMLSYCILWLVALAVIAWRFFMGYDIAGWIVGFLFRIFVATTVFGVSMWIVFRILHSNDSYWTDPIQIELRDDGFVRKQGRQEQLWLYSTIESTTWCETDYGRYLNLKRRGYRGEGTALPVGEGIALEQIRAVLERKGVPVVLEKA